MFGDIDPWALLLPYLLKLLNVEQIILSKVNLVIFAIGRMPYMKIDIPYYIRQVLREQRKVYIPEVGTFNVLQSPARISDDKSRIYPPTLDIEFKDGLSDDKSLKKYIQDTGKFSNKKINTAITEYSQSIYNNLINLNANKIDGIGALSRNEELDKVTFEPTLDLFTKEYKNLKPLSIHPIDRIKENTAIDHAVNMEGQVVRAESKYRWLQPILAGILIAALVVLAWTIYSDRNTDSMLYHNPDESSEVQEEINSNDAVDTFFDEASTKKELSLDAKYKEVDKMLDGDPTSEESEAKLDEELEELEDNTKSNLDAVAKVKTEVVDVVKDIPKAIIEETVTEKTAETPKNKYEAIIPQSGKCIIILASLKKASNITRMISVIERDGKKAYTSQYKGITRVGFTFDCSNVDLDVYLTDIRKRLASKAWYLDPTLAIPYK